MFDRRSPIRQLHRAQRDKILHHADPAAQHNVQFVHRLSRRAGAMIRDVLARFKRDTRGARQSSSPSSSCRCCCSCSASLNSRGPFGRRRLSSKPPSTRRAAWVLGSRRQPHHHHHRRANLCGERRKHLGIDHSNVERDHHHRGKLRRRFRICDGAHHLYVQNRCPRSDRRPFQRTFYASACFPNGSF